MSHALLEARNLYVYRGDRLVLSQVSFEFSGGEQVALIGQNGSGKTTLLMALAGITKYEGEIFYQNKPCHHGEHRQQIGYVPQRSQVRWDLPLQVLDVVKSGTAGNPHLRDGFTKESVRRGHIRRFDRSVHFLWRSEESIVFLVDKPRGF